MLIRQFYGRHIATNTNRGRAGILRRPPSFHPSEGAREKIGIEVRMRKLPNAFVIRNAGGRASDDAIRSLVISYKLLGTGPLMPLAD